MLSALFSVTSQAVTNAHLSAIRQQLEFLLCNVVSNKLSPRGRRDDMSPPMAARLASDLRPSADGSAVRKSLVSGGGYSLGLGQLRA